MDKLLLPEDMIRQYDLFGLGEGSHGTKEYQIIRLNIIKQIHKIYRIILFIEEDYFKLDFFKTLNRNLTKSTFISTIMKSQIYCFYKSKEFIEILYYAYRNNIPVIGVDIQTGTDKEKLTDLEKYIVKMNSKFIKKSTNKLKLRDTSMQSAIDMLIKGVDAKGIF